MRIAVLVYQLRVAGGLSVGKNIVTALQRVADEHEYLFVLPESVGYREIRKPSRSELYYFRRTHGAVSHVYFECLTMPGLVRAFGPDVVWGLSNSGLASPGARQAILFHNAEMLYEGRNLKRTEFRRRIVLKAMRRRLARALPATQLVFCQTEVTAERFRRSMKYTGRIALMPNAVSEVVRGREPGKRPAVFDRLPGRKVLFCLTRYYTHKNLEILVEVFRRHAGELRDVAIVFTVSPEQHKLARALLRRLEEPGRRQHLVNVGPVAQEDLPAYFAASDGLILPTLLESFSGTYLEAMEYECPILTSDMDFAHAVCGSAARYFDPFDPASIRDAILELTRGPELRSRLVAAGIERRKAFVRDWDSVVTDAVAELKRLV